MKLELERDLTQEVLYRRLVGEKIKVYKITGWRNGLAHQSHDLEVEGSNPSPVKKESQ